MMQMLYAPDQPLVADDTSFLCLPDQSHGFIVARVTHTVMMIPLHTEAGI